MKDFVCVLRPCILLTQLVVLDFRELLDLTLTKVLSGYITWQYYITSFVKNNEFFCNYNEFFDKIC